MEKRQIKEILKSVGYSSDGIKSIMTCRRRPMIEKQYEMLDKFKIPLEAWRDIKQWLSHAQSMPDTSVHVQEESENQLHQKESA